MTAKKIIVGECKNCVFVLSKHKEYVPMVIGQDAPKNYYCRRYPPSDAGIIQVSPAGWCGEYDKKKLEKKK